MYRDNSSDQETNFQSKNERGFSAHDRKSKANKILNNQESLMENSDLIDQQPESKRQAPAQKNRKMFSDISKSKDASPIRNKNKFNDSDNYPERPSSPSSTSKETNNMKYQTKNSIKNINRNSNNNNDDNIRSKPGIRPIRTNKSSAQSNFHTHAEKKKKKTRKKYIYSSNHSNINLMLEKSFELDVPQLNSLNSLPHRKNIENKIEVRLPERRHSTQQKTNKRNTKTTAHKNTYQLDTYNNKDFIQVGSGDDMKIIFNVAKYYTDLGEQIATEVIFNSLRQIKHHDIILHENEPTDEINNTTEDNEQFPHANKTNQQMFLLEKDHNNKDFMVVGSGNDMKVVLNISKYYNDLGEKIATEVIENSLSQVKHHGILTDKEKILNDTNNYVFNYHDDQTNNDNKNNNQKLTSFNQNDKNAIQQFPKSKRLPQRGFNDIQNPDKMPNISQNISNETSFTKGKENKDFIQVGSGDDMKIIFNVAKYYTDLGEQIATEVIFNSLRQIKHHDIILHENEPTDEINNTTENNDRLLDANNNIGKDNNDENNQQMLLLEKDHNNKDFMVVGSGNDMKVVLNISKYYNDLGEKIATEVIENSLSQVKHHGILTDKEKILNDTNNYVFNYHDDQTNNDNENSNSNTANHSEPNQNYLKSSPPTKKVGQENKNVQSPSPKIKKRRKEPNEMQNSLRKDLDSSLKRVKSDTTNSGNEIPPKLNPKNKSLEANNSDALDSSLTNVVKMVPVSEEDILPLDDEMIPNSKSSYPSKTSKTIKDRSYHKHKKSNHIKNDLLHTDDDLSTISESKEQIKSKNSFVSDNFMSSDFDVSEKKKSKIVVIKTSSGHRKSTNLDSLSESEMQSGQPSFKKRPINLLSSHSQITNSFENLKNNQEKIRKAKSTNILPHSSSLAPNNDSSSCLPQNEQQHLPPVQQSPRNMKSYLGKQTSSSQTLTINRGTKNTPLHIQPKTSLNSSEIKVSKSLSTDITLSKDFDDSSSIQRKKKVNSPISPIANSNPFNEFQNSHK